MKIAVNTRLLLPGKLEGIGWFTYEIFKRLSSQKSGVDWLFVFDRPYSEEFVFSESVRPLVTPPPSRHPLLWYIWFEFSLPRLLRRHQVDLLISPDGYIPLRAPCRTLPVIHDINFEHQKKNLDPVAGAYMRHFFPRFAQKATRVGTVSEYSRQDIARTYGVSEAKIDLIYNGVSDFFEPLPPETQQAVRGEYAEGCPYFIFIGALNPRKNIGGMLRAYEIYRQRGGQAHFVIVGEKMLWDSEVEKIYREHAYQNAIHFTGRLEGQGLNRVLAAAQALLFVSHFEGFGIPILEAFRSEVPVITATNSSMPEVAGGAALLCDSDSISQISEAMQQTDDPALRIDLIERGRKRGADFSWQRSADMMWASIEKTLDI